MSDKPIPETTAPRFALADVEQAAKEWGCNCGPAALAAVTGHTLDEVRPHLEGFDAKRYTNPTMMWAALKNLGARFSYRGGHLGRSGWPTFGLARIQWEGPWTKPGVPARAAYRHTHWIGVSARTNSNVGIFDVNAINNGTGWVSLSEWTGILVPWLLGEIAPRASGDWFITHAVEVHP